MTRACYILSNVGLDKTFRFEAFNIAWYFIDQSSSIVIKYKIAHMIQSDHFINYFYLRIFYYPVYVQMNDGKLKLKAKRCIFFDYTDGVKRNKLQYTNDSRSPKIIISRDITFDESTILHQKKESVKNICIKYGVNKQVKVDVESLERVSQNYLAQLHEIEMQDSI